MAMVNSRVTTEVVNLEQFPDLGAKYSVSGVPKGVLNDKVDFVGAAPEEEVLKKILSLNGS